MKSWLIDYRFWNGEKYVFACMTDSIELNGDEEIEFLVTYDSKNKKVHEGDFVEINNQLAKAELTHVHGVWFKVSEFNISTLNELMRNNTPYTVVGNHKENPELEEAWRNGSYNKQPV